MEIINKLKNVPINFYIFGLIFLSIIIRIFSLNSHNLLVEEAYYWNYAQHMDFSYLDHPPMVALLIKIFTTIFGSTEFVIHLIALLCWMVAAFFNYKWAELIQKDNGLGSLLLLSILPFFFLQSIILTPDMPLLACWSASLYYLYRAIILEQAKSWYLAGFWIGLGLLSKYSIVLLGPAIIICIISTPNYRFWLTRKEPYLAALIAFILFTPVIYWNFIHDWASFVFQSTRRFNGPKRFSLHHFFLVLTIFLTPLGLLGLKELIFGKNNSQKLRNQSLRFIQIFTIFPLTFFGVYSINHPIKLDWIGPTLLGVIPWLSCLIKNQNIYKRWFALGGILLTTYLALIFVFSIGKPVNIPRQFFIKFISWDDLTQQFIELAKNVEKKTQSPVAFVPMELYNIGSEILYYQNKKLKNGSIDKIYPVIGAHVLGKSSLMFEYWNKNPNLDGKKIILISNNINDFDSNYLQNFVNILSPLKKIWSHRQNSGQNVSYFYYQIAEMKAK